VAGSRLLQELGHCAGRDRVGDPGFAVSLGSGVAKDLAAVRGDDDDPVTEALERGGKPVAVELCVRGPCSVVLAARRAQPNLPVM
jgi:hypothetical protein